MISRASSIGHVARLTPLQTAAGPNQGDVDAAGGVNACRPPSLRRGLQRQRGACGQ